MLLSLLRWLNWLIGGHTNTLRSTRALLALSLISYTNMFDVAHVRSHVWGQLANLENRASCPTLIFTDLMITDTYPFIVSNNTRSTITEIYFGGSGAGQVANVRSILGSCRYKSSSTWSVVDSYPASRPSTPLIFGPRSLFLLRALSRVCLCGLRSRDRRLQVPWRLRSL